MEARIDTHPPIDSLKAFGLGLLDDASAQALFLHLEDCPACRRRAEEASGDDFLSRLQKARASNSTPAPPRQLPPLPGVARVVGHDSTLPPDPARSLGSSLFGESSSPESAARPSVPADIPPELVANQQYEVIRELGRGGMGVVYLARNKQMDRLEVLKVVNRALLERPGTADRFLREIRSAAALEHRNVVRAYACLQAGKLLALVMEYVEGEDLAHLVERRGPLSVPSACASVIQAARGLQEAHDKGMVHRDIKPQNLLLSRKLKEVMILDFGLAKVASEKGVEQGLTAAGKMLGTPGYVAPEQIRDASSADIRADIYSLGCTLYYLLSGHPPFEAPSLFALLHAHQFTDAESLDVERPNVPPELAAVVARMMAKDPAKRYQKPADVAAALAPFVKGGKPAAPVVPKPAKQEAMVTASVPPPLPVHVQVELAPAPAVERAPFDLEDLPAPAVSRKRKKNRGALVAVMLALLVPLVVGVAVTVLRMETPNGTLIVEVNDPDVEARIKGGKLILTGPDGKDRYILTAADRNSKQKVGEYKIRVQGADGLEVNTPEFVMKKGGVVKVRVTMAMAKQVPGPLPVPPGIPGVPNKRDAITNSIGMKLAYIPAGEFMMGSPEEEGRDDERPRHKVKITKAFYLSIHEVKQGQFKAVMGYNPSYFSRDGTKKPGATYFVNPAGGKDKIGATDDPDDYPVENISWEEAKEYCEKLSALKKEKESGHLYRLPTEAEWEYSCRGGSVQYKKFYFGDELTSDDANFDGKLGRPSTVGSYKKPNKFGLHDMHGNVWEWCSDWYNERCYANSPEADPPGGNGSDRVSRGGGWSGAAEGCSAGFRNSSAPALRSSGLGFRVALVPSLELKTIRDPDRKAAEFVSLFNGKDLTGWSVDSGDANRWVAKDGEITATGAGSSSRGWLLTDKEYVNFVLNLEFKVSAGSDGGVGFHARPGDREGGLPHHPVIKLTGHSAANLPRVGALYWKFNTWEQPGNPPRLAPEGGWNKLEIRVRGDELRVQVNGQEVQTLSLERFASKAGAFPGLGRSSGRIGLQQHSKETHFRSIEVKELPPVGTGFVPLFNGKNLTGWKTHEKQRGNWRVEGNILIGSGPAVSHLYTDRNDYKDFHLRVEARINDGGNSGVYARSPFGPTEPAENPKWLVGLNAKLDKDRLGGLYVADFRRSHAPPAPAGQWITLELIAKGNHTLVKVNGETTADYTDEKRLFTSGHIALQQHTAQTIVEFRKIEIMESSGEKTSAVSDPDRKAAEAALPPPPPPSPALVVLSRDKLPPEALALAGDGDPKRAPASLVGILGDPRPTHTGFVRGLSFSADGKWLASGCTAGTIIIRDVATGRAKKAWKGHAGEILSTAFSKDSKTLATASFDGTVKLWPMDKLDEPRTLKPELGAIYCMAVSADGRFLAAAGMAGGVKLWKWGQWDAPLAFPVDPARPWSDYKGGKNNDSLALSPDGRFLAIRTQVTNEDAPVHLFGTADGKWVKTLPGKWCGNPACGYSMAMAFSPGGKYLASFASGKNATVWDVASGAIHADFPSAQYGAVAISPDDEKVAVIRDIRYGVEVYDRKTQQKERTLAGGVGDGMAVTFSPDGKSLACGFCDGSVHVWDTTKWEEKYLEGGHLHRVRSAAFGLDGHTVLSAGDDNTLREWDLKDAGKGRIRRKLEARLNYAAYSPDKKKYATSACSVWYDWSQTGLVWDASNDTQLFAVAPPVGLHSIVFSPDGKLLAGSSWPPPGKTPHVHLWDAETGKEVHRFADFGDAQNCTPAFSKDGKLLAVASPKQIKVWEVDSCKEVHSWQDDFLCAAAFSPDARTLATGHTNGTITLWDLTAGKKKKTLTGHTAGVKSLKYTPDGKRLVSSGDDGTIRVWNPDWERAKHVIPLGPANQRLVMDIDPSGKYLIAAGHSPVIFILRLPEDEPKAALDPDRKAAEYVVSIGGFVRVNEEGRDIKVVDDLPKEAFRLTYVAAGGNAKLRNSGLVAFNGCKNLTHLDLYETQVKDVGLAHFKDCKNLKFLKLSRVEVSDTGLAHFKNCTNLEHLDLRGTQISDDGMALFKNCVSLKYLDVVGTRLTDDGFSHLKGCKDLAELLLDDTRVSDAGLAHFKGCKNLTHLWLKSTKVTDIGLVHFKDCKNLGCLVLSGTQVTDAGVASFKDRKKLDVIELYGTKVTARGIEEMKKALPKCTFKWNDPDKK